MERFRQTDPGGISVSTVSATQIPAGSKLGKFPPKRVRRGLSLETFHQTDPGGVSVSKVSVKQIPAWSRLGKFQPKILRLGLSFESFIQNRSRRSQGFKRFRQTDSGGVVSAKHIPAGLSLESFSQTDRSRRGLSLEHFRQTDSVGSNPGKFPPNRSRRGLGFNNSRQTDSGGV